MDSSHEHCTVKDAAAFNPAVLSWSGLATGAATGAVTGAAARPIKAFAVAATLCVTVALSPGCSSRVVGPGVVDADAPKEFTTTDSGLKYRILRKSAGPKPAATDDVVVDYSGWLDDGTIFDSSYERPDSTEFNLSGVIPGWTEGLQLVGEGGMIELEIPSELAYGEQGQPHRIPPGATLHFKVELQRVK